MKRITIWESRADSGKQFSHNHISDGFDPGALTPSPMSEFQKKSWAGQEWNKLRAWLIDGVVTIDSYQNTKE